MEYLKAQLVALLLDYRKVVKWVHTPPSRLYCTECGAEGGPLDHTPTCSMRWLEDEINMLANSSSLKPTPCVGQEKEINRGSDSAN